MEPTLEQYEEDADLENQDAFEKVTIPNVFPDPSSGQ